MMSHCIIEPDILMQLWPNILLGWMFFSFYGDIQDYDQLSATCFETMYSNEPDITSSYDIMFTTVALSKHVVAWTVNYFLGMDDRLDATNSKMTQQLLLPNYVTWFYTTLYLNHYRIGTFYTVEQNMQAKYFQSEEEKSTYYQFKEH